MQNNIIKSALFTPQSLTSSNAWVGHIPFAAWLINEVKPKVFVELGTYSGNSYFSFCQAAVENKLSVNCYAVDTWQGDEHSGNYDEDIFKYVEKHNSEHYSCFSSLLRLTFDDAVAYFSDNTIDLLHIDGLHTYEAVKHDFETWLPKLSPNAVILFHDINVRENGFGVWKLWEELQETYPMNLEFLHSHGLGVLTLSQQDSKSYPWMISDSEEQSDLKETFPIFGKRLLDRFDLLESKRIIVEKNDQLIQLNTELDGCIIQIAALNHAVTEGSDLSAKQTQQIIERDQQIIERDQQIIERDQQSVELIDQLSHINDCLVDCQEKLTTIVQSRSWFITKPLRFVARLLRGECQPCREEPIYFFRRAKNALSYIEKGDFKGFYQRLKAVVQGSNMAAMQHTIQNKSSDKKKWAIMTPKHTIFIATMIADRLKKHGFQVEIFSDPVETFPFDWYLVICPQMFTSLPPGEKRIVFQMEQSVSSRWFNDDYFNTLKSSLAILEYSLTNIAYLSKKEITFPLVHYLPVGASNNYGQLLSSQEEKCEILFYGDSKSSSRRRKMLTALKKHYDVRVVSEVFGSPMQQEIKNARLVVNLHYYENALLEMPRIQECLSLGVPVVSESTQDQGEYPELEGAVHFFEQGSINAMLEVVGNVLKDLPSAAQVQSAVNIGQQRFSFMFDRFMVAMGFLPTSHVDDLVIPSTYYKKYVALSLPETIDRRQVFESIRPNDCAVFDGIRCAPGWVGCGLSYKVLAKNALAHGLDKLVVMEDDVILPELFDDKMTIINEYLEQRSDQWDLFSGVIASLHEDVKILSVEEYKGMTFAIIDKMTSTVFNIYSKKALSLFSSWDSEWLDAEKNTIDRYIENQTGLRVVVALPFLVGHREEVHSTLWGFQNTTYSNMIDESEKALLRHIDKFNRSKVV